MIGTRPVTAVIWDYDGTLVDTRAKNWRITRDIVQHFTGTDPDTIEALSSLDGYTIALHHYHDWRHLYMTEFGMSEETLSEAGRLWTEYQLSDDTLAPIYTGVESALGKLRNLPHGIVSMNSKDNIERSLAKKSLLDRFEFVIGFVLLPVVAVVFWASEHQEPQAKAVKSGQSRGEKTEHGRKQVPPTEFKRHRLS